MKLSTKWLMEYLDRELVIDGLAHRLTMRGIEVEDIRTIGGWAEVYVGAIEDVQPHPSTDRLLVCTVSMGEQESLKHQVVCGAPNVALGRKVCLALAGASLFNPDRGASEEVATANVRGVESQGMLCSEAELGIGDDHAGIVILPDEAPLGSALDDYLADTIMTLKITTNRGDCQSMLGVAHEVAALHGGSVLEPEHFYEESGVPIRDRVTAAIDEPDLCQRYTASLIEGVAIGESPWWVQQRLLRAGVRPINNVVDATNYVMLEYNQPLHAFDLDRVAGASINVRTARPGEKLTTLDGEVRTLSPDNLVIADSDKPIALAGIIGGANSEIGPGTTSVLLESATFEPFNNRHTSRRAKLRTEASARFEKGLRPELALIALRRATALIQQLAGGTAAPGIIDVFPDPPATAPVVRLTTERLRQVLGMDLNLAEVQSALDALDLHHERIDGRTLTVTIPYWRSDLSIEEDLIEEVIRVIGYETVPTIPLSAPIPYQSSDRHRELRNKLKQMLVAAGLQEVISYPAISKADLDNIAPAGEVPAPVRIANPISDNHEFMRTNLQPGLLKTLASNQGEGRDPIRLFEVGRVFRSRADVLPREVDMAAVVMAGPRRVSTWLDRAETVDFYDAKGLVEQLLSRLGVESTFAEANHPAYHPGKCAEIRSGDAVLGHIGELHPTVREAFGLDNTLPVGFELQLPLLESALPDAEQQFVPLPRFPAANRDFDFVVPMDVPGGRIQDLVSGHPLVEHAELFDVYRGEGVPEGSRSMTFRIYFRHTDRTLTSEEVDHATKGILKCLKREAGVILRTQ